MPESKTCFVIAPIGADGSSTRRRSDQVLKYVIRPVANEYGYEAKRADDVPLPGMITSQVISELTQASLVIADLTENNPNVFYELALRHVSGKPVIHLIDIDQQIPFDVQPFRAIQFDITNLDSVAHAKDVLSQQINAIDEGLWQFDNPVSQALSMEALRRSGNPEEMVLADVKELMAGISVRMARLESRMPTPLASAACSTRGSSLSENPVRLGINNSVGVSDLAAISYDPLPGVRWGSSPISIIDSGILAPDAYRVGARPRDATRVADSDSNSGRSDATKTPE